MKRLIFRGAGVAIATPFAAQGVDLRRLSLQVRWQIARGAAGIVVCGSTGEAPTLSDDEREIVIGTAIEAAQGRVPVIAGTGANSTARTIDWSLRAQRLGADGLLIVTPYYNRPGQSGLVRHYVAVADKVDLPIILYNVPGRTGVNLLPETCLALSAHPNIAGLKEAHWDMAQLAQTAQRCSNALPIYAGSDEYMLCALALGAVGMMTVIGNILPTEAAALFSAFDRGDIAAARTLYLRLLPMMGLLSAASNPRPLKAAMAMLGLDTGQLRLPLTDVSDELKGRIEAELKRLGLELGGDL